MIYICDCYYFAALGSVSVWIFGLALSCVLGIVVGIVARSYINIPYVSFNCMIASIIYVML